MPNHPDPRWPTGALRLEPTRLPTDTPLDAVFERACEVTVAANGVARAGVWLVIDGRTVLRCATVFEHSTGEHSTGAVIRPADCPAYFQGWRPASRSRPRSPPATRGRPN